MDWKAAAILAVSCLAAGIVLGLTLGLRGCGGGASKLLQENAELKAEVTRQRFLADQAEELRAQHAERRNTAERALAAMEEQEAESANTIKHLRRRVVQAGRKTDERDDLIVAIDRDRTKKGQQVDLLEVALAAAADEIAASYDVEAALELALSASEKRADKLERHVMKERPKRILIGVGSAVGASLLTLGSVYAAGKL